MTVRAKSLPSQELVREWLDYEPKTGVLTWKKNSWSKNNKGQPAGHLSVQGYVRICLLGKNYVAHRLVWTWVHGVDVGAASLDHIDGNRANNAIANLRIANSFQQAQNARCRKHSKSGLKGAFYCPGTCASRPWRSEIQVEKRVIRLGLFATAEEAHAAYAAAAIKYFGEFARVA